MSAAVSRVLVPIDLRDRHRDDLEAVDALELVEISARRVELAFEPVANDGVVHLAMIGSVTYDE